jgi:hypothetical protein
MNLETAHRPDHEQEQEHETEGIATFETYAEASAAVDELAEREFPVERTTIVAKDLRLVEDVQGRRTPAALGRAGALWGAVVGVVVGIVLGLFGDGSWLGPGALGALLGAVAGGTLAYGGGSLQRRRFASVRRMRAECYELTVQSRWAEEARSLVTTWRLSRTPERLRAVETQAE